MRRMKTKVGGHFHRLFFSSKPNDGLFSTLGKISANLTLAYPLLIDRAEEIQTSYLSLTLDFLQTTLLITFVSKCVLVSEIINLTLITFTCTEIC